MYVDTTSVGAVAWPRCCLAGRVHPGQVPRELLRGLFEHAAADDLHPARNLEVARVGVVLHEGIGHLRVGGDNATSDAAPGVVVHDHGVAVDEAVLEPGHHWGLLLPSVDSSPEPLVRGVTDDGPRIVRIRRRVPVVAESVGGAICAHVDVDAAGVGVLAVGPGTAPRVHALDTPSQGLPGSIGGAHARDGHGTLNLQIARVAEVGREGGHCQLVRNDDAASNPSTGVVVDDHGVTQDIKVRESSDNLDADRHRVEVAREPPRLVGH
mmetsp:Transcript_82471/g.207531  ORF Transcript_82471/g.207531 Transcript_82471/m.207531 type:complete len:267 (+) Transcript_82471:479-1279(+)